MSEIDEMLKKGEELRAAREDLRKQFREKGTGPIVGILQAVLEKHPNAIAIEWTQYTPFFNDGEPCVLGVHDACVRTEADVGHDDGHYISSSCYYKPDPAIADLMSDAGEAWKKVQMFHEFMEDIFGDGVLVRVDRDGLTISDYDHD